ncbi:transcriptional regulator, ArsR family [Jatrophihabitans endophyticus]|uniref:Transcriptional regulator, ArsR family n=1 Tax=Jatrophihabitans endophyticus TaxID=1206085 RepID=A0A1M5EQJ1_9ACTN|nr:winged helix-turn-helix domain-containing protein [Jatrophihabitans endophyticus]SHF81515.1 transcriptional regulator, ArsR family [Jatrophihabitans endophyticus]
MTQEWTTRQITDAKALAAVTHPLRRRLMDILLLDGPATASMLAERTGQAVGNISHHLRTLAASDLVAEAPELARDRRERWWRLVTRTVQWSTTDFADDPASDALERAASSLNLERQAGYVRAWNEADQDARETWGEGPFSTNTWLRLTPAELEQFSREFRDLAQRWRERELPDDGARRDTVFVFCHGVPAQP